jgi:tripartite-type tricarboxylate transporter receptor subunit TctC
MTIDRRQVLSLAAASAIFPFVTSPACAEAYPARPVRIIAGFPAGGAADVAARLIGAWLQARLGQPFIIENRPGASTSLATEAVVRAPADGYMLLLTTTSNLLNGALFDDLKYDFVRDIAPVASLMLTPLVLLVNPTTPAESVPEFIAYAKANPGKINVGHFGTGTVSHLAGEAFKMATGVDIAFVPYRGSVPMLTDLLGGRIDAAFDTILASTEHIKSGGLRPLAVTSATRSEALPDVPAVSEFIAGYVVIPIAGVGAPRGTSANIVEKLNKEINAGLADTKLKSRLTELGAIALPGSPTDFATIIARETEKWGKVIKASGVKLN